MEAQKTRNINLKDMRLSLDLVEKSASFLNTLGDRELDLRGNKIQKLENIGVYMEQHDTIDFSDNDIRVIENFPVMRKLKNIYICNNKVCKIFTDIHVRIPGLRSLILTNNYIESFLDIQSLTLCPGLKILSLIGNPITKRNNYRSQIVHNLPSLEVLDFLKITASERETAKTTGF